MAKAVKEKGAFISLCFNEAELTLQCKHLEEQKFQNITIMFFLFCFLLFLHLITPI